MQLSDIFLTFLPETLLLVFLVFLLMMKIFSDKTSRKTVLNVVSVFFLVAAVATLVVQPEGSLFGGMFVATSIISLEKVVLLLATFLISLQAYQWLSHYKNFFEFYMLLLSVLFGMFLMISSGHFLMFYLGLEMATIPLAALSAFDLEKPRSGEAGMKLILTSAFSSGIILMGISFIYGTCGSLYFDQVKTAFDGNALQLMAFAFLVAGFAFKISVVPFHLWTADVYEGSPISITSFLSVVSKGAAVFIFLTALYHVFGAIQETWTYMIAVLAVITMTVGNLFAIRQKNIKRFLAFSSIAQAGYILIGVSAASQQGNASVVYFILVYLFSNLAAFNVANVISDRTGKENISDYNGLYQTNPKLSIVMMLAVFSLAGIPPTAGFFGKWFLLASGISQGMMVIIIIAALNLVISLYYYLRIVKAMFVDKNAHPIVPIRSHNAARIGLVICTLGIILTGFFSFVYDYIYAFSQGVQ